MRPWPLLFIMLLVPTTSALTTISVTTTDEVTRGFTQPFSDTYGFSFSPTVFDAPIYRADVALSWDFGTVSANQVVHVQSDWRLRAEGGYYTDVSIRSYGEKTWFGSSFVNSQVFVNGTDAWDPPAEPAGLFGAHFHYQQTHYVQYGENVTAQMPRKPDGETAWDWADAEPTLGSQSPGTAGTGRATNVEIITSGWFYVPADQTDIASRHENNSAETWNPAIYMWLANDTHPTELSVSTYYQDRIPTTLDMVYEFDEELSFFADVAAGEDCGGVSRIFLAITGVCPTLASVVAWTIRLIPTTLAFFLDFISPEAAGFLRLCGELAGEFVAAIVFTTTLLLLAPGKLFVIVAATVSGGVNLAAALRGDFGTWIEWHIAAFRILMLGVFWYFYLYFLLARFAFETIVKIVDTIGGYIPLT